MTMPRGPNSTNGRVSKTCVLLRSLNGANIAALEREIATPDDQVQHQLNSPPTRPARVAPNTLDDVQVNILVEWIRQEKELFCLPMGPLITTNDLKPSKVRSVKKKRINASDQETLKNWYPRLEAVVASVSPGTADGWAADPFILIQGDHYFDEWLTYERTPDGTGFMLNPGGRVSEKAACEWIGSFHRQTKDRTADGHPRQVNRFKSTRPPWRQMLNMMDG
ncbi:hypothetical protein LT330_004918 [Penicillium expansum]|nr:hypothetical protein LT330_004918 [Penicillium expansum]